MGQGVACMNYVQGSTHPSVCMTRGLGLSHLTCMSRLLEGDRFVAWPPTLQPAGPLSEPCCAWARFAGMVGPLFEAQLVHYSVGLVSCKTALHGSCPRLHMLVLTPPLACNGLHAWPGSCQFAWPQPPLRQRRQRAPIPSAATALRLALHLVTSSQSDTVHG